MVVRGTIKSGHVVPVRPLQLPEGHIVYIVTTESPAPQQRDAALARIRARAVPITLPDAAFTSDSLYED